MTANVDMIQPATVNSQNGSTSRRMCALPRLPQTQRLLRMNAGDRGDGHGDEVRLHRRPLEQMQEHDEQDLRDGHADQGGGRVPDGSLSSLRFGMGQQAEGR